MNLAYNGTQKKESEGNFREKHEEAIIRPELSELMQWLNQRDQALGMGKP
jgi:hypothetical protein